MPLHGDRRENGTTSVVAQRILEIDDGSVHVWEGVACKEGETIELVLWDESIGAFVLASESVEDQLVSGLQRAWNGVIRLSRLLTERGSGSVVPLSPAVVFTGEVATTGDLPPPMAPVLLERDLDSLQSLREKLRHIGLMPNTRVPNASSPTNWNAFCEALDAAVGNAGVSAPGGVTGHADEAIASIVRLTLEALEFRLGWPQPFARLEAAAAGMEKWDRAIRNLRNELTFAVVGEFKSGKSTLINALIEEDICFVDDFEATMTLTSFVHGSERSVTCTRSDGQQERWTVEEYKERCARREMADVDRVEVVIETGLPYRLIDTPGLGSITEAHAERAEIALREADALVFLADSSHLGSAQANALLKRAVEIGMPLVVIVSKAEDLSEEDRDAIFAQFSSWFGLPKEDVLFTGLDLEGRLGGLPRVRERLNELAGRGSELRDRANAARSAEIVSEARRIAHHLTELAAADEAWLNTQREEMQHHSRVIFDNIASRFERQLRAGLLVHLAEAREDGTSKPRQAVCDFLQGRALQDLMARLLEELRDQVKDIQPELVRRLDDRCKEVQRQLEDLQLDASARPDDLRVVQERIDELVSMRNALERASPSPEAGSMWGFWVLLVGGALTLLTSSLLPLVLAGPLASLLDRNSKAEPVSALEVSDSVRIEADLEEIVTYIAKEVRTTYEPLLEQAVNELQEVVVADIAHARFSGRGIDDFQRHLGALHLLSQKVTPALQDGKD